jgi:WD40 repeat protein
VPGNPGAIAISKDASSAVVACNEEKRGVIRVLDLHTGEQIARRETESGIRYVFLGKNGFLLAIVGSALRYWSDRSDEKGYQPGPGDDFSNWGSLAFSSDAMLLALFHPDKSTITIYELPSRNAVFSWYMDDPVMDIAFNPANKSRFVSLSKSGTIRMWRLNFETKAAQPIPALQFGSAAGPAFTDAEIGFSNDGRFLAVNEFTGVVRIWNAETGGREMARVFPSKDGPGTVAVDGVHRLIVLAQKGMSQAWQMPSVPLPEWITSANISRDGSLTALQTQSGKDLLWDTATSAGHEADFSP